jgi:hypothetical protein
MKPMFLCKKEVDKFDIASHNGHVMDGGAQVLI